MIPNFFGTRDHFLWKTIFPWTRIGGVGVKFRDDSSTLHLLHTLILLLLHQLHLRSPRIRSWEVGDTCYRQHPFSDVLVIESSLLHISSSDNSQQRNGNFSTTNPWNWSFASGWILKGFGNGFSPRTSRKKNKTNPEPWWHLDFGLVGALVKKPAKPTVFRTHRTVRQCICVV